MEHHIYVPFAWSWTATCTRDWAWKFCAKSTELCKQERRAWAFFPTVTWSTSRVGRETSRGHYGNKFTLYKFFYYHILCVFLWISILKWWWHMFTSTWRWCICTNMTHHYNLWIKHQPILNQWSPYWANIYSNSLHNSYPFLCTQLSSPSPLGASSSNFIVTKRDLIHYVYLLPHTTIVCRSSFFKFRNFFSLTLKKKWKKKIQNLKKWVNGESGR
jgi:hypothetical protein